MGWQDLEAVGKLLGEGETLRGAYVTIARIGENRREAQIGSRVVAHGIPIAEWADDCATAAARGTDGVRLRLRLWRADRTPVRGIQTLYWSDDEEPVKPTASVPAVAVPRAKPTGVAAPVVDTRRPPPEAGPTPQPGRENAKEVDVVALIAKNAELSARVVALQHSRAEERRRADRAEEELRRESSKVRKLEEENRSLQARIRKLRGEVAEYQQVAERAVELVDRTNDLFDAFE